MAESEGFEPPGLKGARGEAVDVNTPTYPYRPPIWQLNLAAGYGTENVGTAKRSSLAARTAGAQDPDPSCLGGSALRSPGLPPQEDESRLTGSAGKERGGNLQAARRWSFFVAPFTRAQRSKRDFTFLSSSVPLSMWLATTMLSLLASISPWTCFKKYS